MPENKKPSRATRREGLLSHHCPYIQVGETPTLFRSRFLVPGWFDRLLSQIDILTIPRFDLIGLSRPLESSSVFLRSGIPFVRSRIHCHQGVVDQSNHLFPTASNSRPGIELGLQNLTANFIAGLMLLFEQHIQVGDRITVGDTEGDVTEINIRSTTIRSLNNIAIVVPNSEFISSTVTNWSHGDPKTRSKLRLGSRIALIWIRSCIHCWKPRKNTPLTLSDPEPKAWLMSFGGSAWNMRLLTWVGDPQGRRQIQSHINCAIVKKFRQNGVEIPFPQRDLHVRSSVPFPISSVES